MSAGAFTDRDHVPSDAEVTHALGPSRARWEALLGELRETGRAKEDFAFLYGRKYGWARRFRARGRLLASLFPHRGYFTVQVNLSPADLAAVPGMRLHRNASSAVEEANLYAEGKWVFVPIKGDADLRDARRLIDLRSGRSR